jgi:formate dehydrogenase maturation protein FdhE
MQNQIKLFLELLDKSGLPDNRVKFWLERLAAENFTLEDGERFTAELAAHLKSIDEAIVFNETQMDAQGARLNELKAEAIPYLKRLALDQPGFYDDDTANFKNTLFAVEKEMMSAVESARAANESQEIEAIRRKLLS